MKCACEDASAREWKIEAIEFYISRRSVSRAFDRNTVWDSVYAAESNVCTVFSSSSVLRIFLFGFEENWLDRIT